jgi:hypothetical protein
VVETSVRAERNHKRELLAKLNATMAVAKSRPA